MLLEAHEYLERNESLMGNTNNISKGPSICGDGMTSRLYNNDS